MKGLYSVNTPEKRKFECREDLERYYIDVEGREYLDTFLVPDMENIKRLIQEKAWSQKRMKDEFDHMTNWQRVFESIWQQTRWLNSYAEINELALKKILKKFCKNYFKIKDNTLKKKLELVINSKQFKRSDKKTGRARDIKMLSDSILRFYADMFQNGEIKQARSVLNSQHN